MYSIAFELEQRRAKLAHIGKYKELKKLYNSKLPEIPNLNTPVFWDKRNSERTNLRTNNPMAYHKYEKVVRMISKVESVLNIGAGSGEVEKRVFGKNDKSEWYGTDISPQSIKNLKKNFPKGKFIKENITKLPFKKNRFDAVIVLDVLEHISPKNIFIALKEIKYVLKQNGILIVSVPLNEGLQEMVDSGYNPNAHVRVYTPELIKAELTLVGFSIQREEYLYAFGNFYNLKTLLCKYFLKGYRKPNLIILKAINS